MGHFQQTLNLRKGTNSTISPLSGDSLAHRTYGSAAVLSIACVTYLVIIVAYAMIYAASLIRSSSSRDITGELQGEPLDLLPKFPCLLC